MRRRVSVLSGALGLLCCAALNGFIVEAYEAEPTHRKLAENSIELAAAPGPWYEEMKKHKDTLTEAAVAEDGSARFFNHFYDPSTGLGLPQNSYNLFFGKSSEGPFPRIISALDWARDGMPRENGKELDWKGAIEAYDYPQASKKRAYEALGHVLHLLHDMAQPDHARDRPHPCNKAGVLAHIKDRVGYETLWTQQPTWPKGTTHRTLTTLEKAFTDLAYESKQAEDSLGLPIPGDELALGCRKPASVTLEALKASGGLITEAAGALVYDANVLRLIVTRGWNSLYDSHWQETELAVPLAPTIPVPPGDFRTRAYLQLGRTMLPKAEEYGAGLLQFFYDIVNPPPFVEEVQIYQKGQRKYRKWWEDQKNEDRVVSRQAKTEGDSVLDSGIEARVYVWFGPRQESDSPVRKDVSTPKVTVVPDGGNASEGTNVTLNPRGELELGPNADKGEAWVGTFTPNGSATLRIEAWDVYHHYKDPLGQREQSLTPVDGKRGTQGDLDSDPSTPARATWRESKAGDQAPAGAPYPWKGYEAGPDTNHKFKVGQKGCPILAQMRWGKWAVTYSRSLSSHQDTEVCVAGSIIACDSAAAHDPATHKDYYRPCSESFTEQAAATGDVVSAWPYDRYGGYVTLGSQQTFPIEAREYQERKVRFPWSQVQPDDFRDLLFGLVRMSDQTISIKSESTCKRSQNYATTNTATIGVGDHGGPRWRTKCDLTSMNYRRRDPSPREEVDEQWTYSFSATEPPPHFRVVDPIAFNHDDLRRAIESVFHKVDSYLIVSNRLVVCNSGSQSARRSCLASYNALSSQRYDLPRGAEQPWQDLVDLFAEADKLWWSRDCYALDNPPADCDPTAPFARRVQLFDAIYQTKTDALRAAASRWQALSSTVARDLSTSIDTFARTMDQWNPSVAGELRVIAQELQVKGFDFSGATSPRAWGSSPKAGWSGGRN